MIRVLLLKSTSPEVVAIDVQDRLNDPDVLNYEKIEFLFNPSAPQPYQCFLVLNMWVKK